METIITKRKNGSKRVQHRISKEGPTEQHHAEFCDINSMMRRFHKTGLLPQCTDQPIYGDFTMADDYLTMRTRISDAQSDFMRLPAELRQRFENDPAQLLRFLENESNRQEAIELGLIPEPAQEPPDTGSDTKTPSEGSQAPLKGSNSEAVKASD